MAMNYAASYPGQTESPTSAYPYGKAKNVSAPGAGDGTPWIAPIVNDIWGFFAALLGAAAITPNGEPDKVGASQYYNAMNNLFNQRALGTLIAPGLLQLSNDTSSASNALAASIGALNALRSVAATAATTSNPGIVQLSNNPVDTSDSYAATIGALNALRTLLGVNISGSSASWSVRIGKLKINGGQATVNGTTVNVTLNSAYTGGHLSFGAWINTNAGSGNNEPISSAIVSNSQGAIRSNSGQNNFTAYLSFGYDA